MFKKDEVPSHLWGSAEALNTQIQALKHEIEAFQKVCKHSWQKVMKFDFSYSPRLDGLGKGQEVIKEFHCATCNLHKPFEGLPYQICHKCGGEMRHDRREQFGMDTAKVHKCQSCGHEYDTT